MSDLKPFADNPRARVIRPEPSRARTFFARRSEPLTARTDDRPSGYQRKVSVGAIGSFIVCSVPCFLFVSVWPGFLKRFGTAELLSVSSRGPEHHMHYARNQLERSNPIYIIEFKNPATGTGGFSPSENSFNLVCSHRGCLLEEAASRH